MSSEYDIIFAGGGTCACVTAGRLAAADPNLRILLIEAGKNTKGLQAHVQPARYPSHLAPHSTTMTFHESQPSPALGGRAAIVPIGHCVGGGSSVNCRPFFPALDSHRILIYFLVAMYTRAGMCLLFKTASKELI
jgi:choline dehydrogenase-like flavoprotein